MSFTFVNLSDILNLKIHDSKTDSVIGYVQDIAADIKKLYPVVKGFIARNLFNTKKRYIPFKNIKIKGVRKIIASDFGAITDFYKDDLSDNEILLKETFFDKQIIDISGSKVVRVNDVHMINEDNAMWVVHMDIGFKGFLRRLGWLKSMNSIIKFFTGYDLQDKFISWKYVQPITAEEDKHRSLLLKISLENLKTLHPADIAEILIDLGLDEKMNLFNSLDIETAANILENLPLKNAVYILGYTDIDRACSIIEEMEIDRAVDLMIRLNISRRNEILKTISRPRSEQIRVLSLHSEKIAGSIMNTEFIGLKPENKVSMALKFVIKKSNDIDAIHHLYVIDDDNKLVGTISLRELLISKPALLIKNIMKENIINVRIDTSIDEVAFLFLKYGLSQIPVVDDDERVVGVISMLDALFQAYPELKQEIEGK
jgi:magnesium transporter